MKNIVFLMFLSLNIFCNAADNQAFIPMDRTDGGPIDPRIEALGLEVFKEMGMSPVPIRWMKSNSSEDVCGAGHTNGREIYISPTYVKRIQDQMSTYMKFGCDFAANVDLATYDLSRLRSLFFHEAAHIKYKHRDRMKSKILGSLTWKTIESLTSVAKWMDFLFNTEKSKEESKFTQTMVGLVGYAFLIQYADSLQKDQEKEADTEGLKATNCEMCVLQSASGLGNNPDKNAPTNSIPYYTYWMIKKGYLSRKECQDIAKKLEGKLCKYHDTAAMKKYVINYRNSF